MAPTHYRLDGLADVDPKPPITWIRGAEDLIVSDTSMFDLAYLGSIRAVPGWPGADVAHSPHVEKPKEFMAALVDGLR